MKRIFSGLIILSCFFIFWNCQSNRSFSEKEIGIIPQVQKMTLGQSAFRFKRNTKFVVENIEQKEVARQLTLMFGKAAGWEPAILVGANEGSNQVYFRTEPVMRPEEYSIGVTNKQIVIKASRPAGFFYAVQTLRQLLPVAIESNSVQKGVDWLVPVISIQDYPAFPWRGYMLDVVRHFFPKEDILKMIDYLALHKINTLHLHLVDDQGWRIEIKKYPKLTSIGAWRVNHEDLPWNARPAQQPGEKATYGGFYTQNDIREIVAYAQKKFITVVPEIEMPAHVSSALAAYPQFSCSGGPFTVPSGGVWPITDIYCAGNDSTFLFLQDVLTEVMNLFPSKYIHVGGDEATKTEWEKCPKCRNRIKTEGLKNVGELQSYFIRRIEQFINSKGRILLGWDEILEGGLPPKATVMSWRGIQGGIDAARQGHDVVMTPGSPCYFDHYQGQVDQEPPAIGGFNPLKKVYEFNPVPVVLTEQEAKHIIGGQANLWTEYVPNFKHAEYMTFPRIAAFSEALWTPGSRKNWDDFSRRILLMFNRYEKLGINYAKSSFQVIAKTSYDSTENKLAVSLSGELPGTKIYYTTDGTDPAITSQVYSNPILIDRTTTLKAFGQEGNGMTGSMMSATFNINKATFKPVKYLTPYNDSYKGSGDITLVNGVRGTSNFSDGQWQGWNGGNMSVVIDLQQQTQVSKISVGSIQNANAWIFFPKKVEFYLSPDETNFRFVAETENDIDPLAPGVRFKDFSAKFEPVTARFIKIIARNPGNCPAGTPGENQPAWLFADEVSVE